MVEIYKTISRVAPTDALVLIEGETGAAGTDRAHAARQQPARGQAVSAGGLRFAGADFD